MLELIILRKIGRKEKALECCQISFSITLIKDSVIQTTFLLCIISYLSRHNLIVTKLFTRQIDNIIL
jgi:hypothetical protein